MKPLLLIAIRYHELIVAGSLDNLNVEHDKLKQHGSVFGYSLRKCKIIIITENINQAENCSTSEIKNVDEHRVVEKR